MLTFCVAEIKEQLKHIKFEMRDDGQFETTRRRWTQHTTNMIKEQDNEFDTGLNKAENDTEELKGLAENFCTKDKRQAKLTRKTNQDAHHTETKMKKIESRLCKFTARTKIWIICHIIS